MFTLIREYIKYCLIAKRRHGIHSPFVYTFGDQCLRLPIPKQVAQGFQELKAGYLRNTSKIEIKDLGAGSKRLQKERSVRQIAKVSGSNKKYGGLLYRIGAFYQPKRILELGTSLGMGTFMLASGAKEAEIVTVEGCPATFRLVKESFPKDIGERVKFVNSSFKDYLQSLTNEAPFDLIFIDGDHQSKSLMEQLELLTPFIHDETIIILDDIRWSRDMKSAWDKLCASPDYHLSIDFFRMGILMKRKHQEKEHFVMR